MRSSLMTIKMMQVLYLSRYVSNTDGQNKIFSLQLIQTDENYYIQLRSQTDWKKNKTNWKWINQYNFRCYIETPITLLNSALSQFIFLCLFDPLKEGKKESGRQESSIQKISKHCVFETNVLSSLNL
jgi:hypothetical protein